MIVDKIQENRKLLKIIHKEMLPVWIMATILMNRSQGGLLGWR